MKSSEATIRNKRKKNEKRNAVKLMAVTLLAIFVLVGMRSTAARIQYENNILEEKNAYLQAEIDSLNSQIVEETKVTKIEKVATEQYGMVYPTSDNCVRLSAEESETEDLAVVIRSEAYN